MYTLRVAVMSLISAFSFSLVLTLWEDGEFEIIELLYTRTLSTMLTESYGELPLLKCDSAWTVRKFVVENEDFVFVSLGLGFPFVCVVETLSYTA